MKNLRKYGKAPFNIAAIHGGFGTPGYMVNVILMHGKNTDPNQKWYP